MDILHTAVIVRDIETTLEYYCDGLGLKQTKEIVGDDGVKNYFVSGKSEAELQFRERGDLAGEIDTTALHHLAIAVADVDDAVESLVDNFGATIETGPETVIDLDIRIAFVTDPDGYTVELIEEV